MSGQVAKVLSLIVHDRTFIIALDVVNAATFRVLEGVRLIISVHLLHRIELGARVEAVSSCVAEAAHSQFILSIGIEIHKFHANENGVVDALRQSDNTCLSNTVCACAERADGIQVLFHGGSLVHDVGI